MSLTDGSTPLDRLAPLHWNNQRKYRIALHGRSCSTVNMAFCSFGPIPFIIDKVGKTHRINNNTVIPFKVASTPSGECDRSYSLVHNPHNAITRRWKSNFLIS